MILYGAGPFLRRACEIAIAAGCPPSGCFIEPLGPVPELPVPLLGPYQPEVCPDTPLLLAFQDNTLRRNLSRRIRHPLAKALVHSTARIHPSVQLGQSVLIGPHACIGENTIIGPLCLIEEAAQIGPEVRISEGTFIGSHSWIAPETALGPWTYIGEGAILEPAFTGTPMSVGEGTLIGPYVRLSTSCPPFSCIVSKQKHRLPPNLYI